MSNQEKDPAEIPCTPGDSEAPLEVLSPRDVPFGGLRAMTVRRTLPQRKRSFIGAWCFLDHYGPDRVANTGGMNVAAHPHIGLQTVSWLFTGEIEHRDSAGHHAYVRPGELNLMTGGKGISHSERSTPDTDVLHGAQLWLALPKEHRNSPPNFEHYAPDVLVGHGWMARVFLGSLLGDTSPVKTFTPLVGAEITLEAGVHLEVPLDPLFEHGILVDEGTAVLTATAGRQVVETAELAYLPLGLESLKLQARGAPARLLLLGGTPLDEKIIMWWNFMATTHEEIVQARADWQAQIASVGVPDPAGSQKSGSKPDSARYGLPDGEPELPIPAPPLPNTRLLPRD